MGQKLNRVESRPTVGQKGGAADAAGDAGMQDDDTVTFKHVGLMRLGFALHAVCVSWECGRSGGGGRGEGGVRVTGRQWERLSGFTR